MLTDDGRLKVWNIYNRGMKTGFFATEEHIPSPWHENSIHFVLFSNQTNDWFLSFQATAHKIPFGSFYTIENFGSLNEWERVRCESSIPGSHGFALLVSFSKTKGEKKIQRQSKNFGDPENKASLNSWASESTTKINYFFHTEVEQTNMMRRSCSDGDGEPNNYQESIIPSNEVP